MVVPISPISITRYPDSKRILGITVWRAASSQSGFAKIAAPYLDKLAKELGPHAVKIKDLIGAVK